MRHVAFLVIGSGPAGQKGAIQAAKPGKRVCLVERRARVGGVTVHTGTIPSKTLREAVLHLSGWRQRGLHGRGYRLEHDVAVGDLVRRLDPEAFKIAALDAVPAPAAPAPAWTREAVAASPISPVAAGETELPEPPEGRTIETSPSA